MEENLSILRAQKTQMEELEDTKAFYTVEGVEEAHLLNTDGNYGANLRDQTWIYWLQSTIVTKKLKKIFQYCGSGRYHFSGSRSVFIFNKM